MARGATLAALAALGLATLAGARAGEGNDDGPRAEGSLAWIDSDRLDLVGSIAATLPVASAGGWRILLRFGTVTAIERATSDLTFEVTDVSYLAAVGARRPLPAGGAIEVFAGEVGRVRVDAPGHARVRIVGAGWESRGHRRAFGGFGWSGRAALAAVVEDSGVDADAVADGEVRWLAPVGRVGLGVDGTAFGLIGGEGGWDLAAGPRLDVDLGGDRAFGVFVRGVRARSPLGLDTDGLVVGFDFAQGSAKGGRVAPPEISGRVAAGGGDGGRGYAEVDLRVASPPFLRGTTATVEVDGNVLGAEEGSDLYYLYDVGFEHPAGPGTTGLWFHHRSNHVLGRANPEVTSLNVLETGFETPGWNREGPGLPLGRAGDLDARLRAGWLIDSAFGEDTAWHARGGVRFAFPGGARTRAYVSGALERGDVAGSAYAVGALLPRGWDVRLEVLHDEQLYAADRRLLLAVATLRY